MNVSLLFPGQGAQCVGMGKDFNDTYQASREVFDQANECLGFDLSKYCFEGPAEELDRTDIAQPAMLVTSMAVLAAVGDRLAEGQRAIVSCAGLSLGEYTALCYAGSIGFEDAVRLVYQRGLFMRESSEKSPGSMLSVMGLSRDDVETVCNEVSAAGTVQVANLNCPGQVVVSGEKSALAAVQRALSDREGVRTIELAVSGAFHSALMADAAGRLAEALEEVEIQAPALPVFSNVTAEEHGEPDDIRKALVEQMTSPVLWEASVRNMLGTGTEACYEVGAGRVLKGLLKRIDRSVRCTSINSVDVVAGEIEL